MLCTLVIAIGTCRYALPAVAIPWSSDQDTVDVCICCEYAYACSRVIVFLCFNDTFHSLPHFPASLRVLFSGNFWHSPASLFIIFPK
jgi:hypothetical protein